jgi:hypothetical protein
MRRVLRGVAVVILVIACFGVAVSLAGVLSTAGSRAGAEGEVYFIGLFGGSLTAILLAGIAWVLVDIANALAPRYDINKWTPNVTVRQGQ